MTPEQRICSCCGEEIFARAGMLILRNTQFGMLLNIAEQ